MRSALYEGTLVHARSRPARNLFRYRVAYLLADLDELDELDRRLRLLAVNRPGVVALRDGDHFDDDGRSLKQKVEAFLARGGVDLAGGRVLALTQPRVFGYVFNPVSFYWCYRPGGELAAIVAEINNTFGERLPQLLVAGHEGEPLVPGHDHEPLVYEHPKQLHVSPFLGLDATYRYRFTEPGAQLRVRMDVHERAGGQPPLWATLELRRRELSDRALAAALVARLMPQRIMWLIHWQALRLWRRGVPVHRKPTFTPGVGSRRP
jgi:DUF1365 family protein